MARSNFSAETRASILQDYLAGGTYEEIATKYGCSRDYVRDLRKRTSTQRDPAVSVRNRIATRDGKIPMQPAVLASSITPIRRSYPKNIDTKDLVRRYVAGEFNAKELSRRFRGDLSGVVKEGEPERT